MAYAGFWQRFGAFLLDFVVLLPLAGLAYVWGDYSRLYQVYWFVPNLLIGLWYNVYLVARYGGTPGKLILNMRIVMVDGSPVTQEAALVRYAVLLVLNALGGIALIMSVLQMTDQEYFSLGFAARGNRMEELTPRWNQTVVIFTQIWILSEFITMLFNRKRRAVHDFMAGTVVLKGRRPDPLRPPAGQEAAGS